MTAPDPLLHALLLLHMSKRLVNDPLSVLYFVNQSVNTYFKTRRDNGKSQTIRLFKVV